MNIFKVSANEDGLTKEQITAALLDSLKGRELRKVLLLPPDFTRFHSNAGFITGVYYKALTEMGVEVDIMPALGTHAPVSREQWGKMFGDIPYEKMLVHDWRHDVVKLGEVPADYISEITEGLWNDPVSVEINRRVMDESYDLIISPGQVVPHEVIGMSNHAKNLFVGVGGSDMINKSHMVGAVYGMERMMGRDNTPVRLMFDYGMEHFLNKRPILFVLTVTTAPGGNIRTHGLFIGEGRECLTEAVKLAQQKNIDFVEHGIKKCVVYLDPSEFKSTWLGNKAVYRTRMAMADGGELIVLAPGVERFGEDAQCDALIRKYGYKGRLHTLEQFNKPENADLRENMGAAAHLIHGSSDGRFSITYAVKDISREEIEGVGFNSASYDELAAKYDPEKLTYGYNTVDGEEIYFIPNPALGLWINREKFEQERNGGKEMYDRIIAFINGGLKDFASCGVYESSLHRSGEAVCFIADAGDRDVIVAEAALGFVGESVTAGGKSWVIGEEEHENADRMRALFPFTAPIPVLKKQRTVGVGDRLGIATPGHIRVFNKYDAYPIFAQQSIRELNLTNRTFYDVLDSASWAVFRENYTRGFGADGDHVKTPAEIEYALSCGYTMITLDCSEHIRGDVDGMSDEAVINEYVADSELEARYVGKSFTVGGVTISYDAASFRRICLIYNEAIDYAVSIWDRYFTGKENAPNFELSIDETVTPTTPSQHFYVANELIRRGVRPATVAPRFCGEFQKGIDYIGDLAQFEREFIQHAAIAKFFGYKISVHSGSDKFSVFSIVGKCSEGCFHLKTAGTNWLEPMKVLAGHEPELYREIHQYALDYAFAEARKYYHVTTDLNNIPALETLSDAELPGLFANNDSRQLIHITYGLILNEKNPDGSFRFRDRMFAAWRKYAAEVDGNIEQHITHHLEKLYSGFAGNK